MPKRVGIRNGENYQIEKLANEGYSPEEVGHILGVKTEVIKNFWPAKKSTRTKKVAEDG